MFVQSVSSIIQYPLVDLHIPSFPHDATISDTYRDVLQTHKTSQKFKTPSKALILATNNDSSINLRKQLGIEQETQMLDKFEIMNHCKITKRNGTLYKSIY